MCIRICKTFQQCGHFSSKVDRCPTYYHNKSLAKGFFGSIFFRKYANQKDCGRVFPTHVQLDYCQKCSVKREQLKVEVLGKGAMRVQHQDLDSRQGSVWLCDLYRNPDKMAGRDAYYRPAAPAPPVSSRPGLNSQNRIQPTERTVGADRKPSRSRLERAPQTLAKPRAPPQPAYHTTGRSKVTARNDPPSDDLPAFHRSNSHPQLRRVKGQVYNSSKSRNPQSVPAYQHGLDAIAFARLQELKQSRVPPARPAPRPVMHGQSQVPTSALSRFVSMTKDIPKGPFFDNDSDVSFVCHSSRQISEQGAATKSTRRPRR
ncbi:hypothetical protein F5Y16DRAFT_193272 [Xylariaceae sp. FL0255]|nr:hypothetical protein F5Y16DRAFT_193272 [Xylariaceae sp. FL0255]